MTTPSLQPRSGRLGGFFLGVLACGMVGALAWLWSSGTASRFDTTRPAVVRQIQQLARLESVLFGMDKIVVGGEPNKYLPQFLVGDRLLLLAYGEVTAGVDLAKLDESHVTINGPSLRIQLPAPEIFTVRIDNERTKVFSRQTGLLSAVDPDLESEVRREAERQVRQAALDNGILRIAGDHARTTLLAIGRALGFEDVQIE